MRRLLDIITEPDNTITDMKTSIPHSTRMRERAVNDCGMFELKNGSRLCNRVFCCGRSAAGGIGKGDHIFYFGDNGTEPAIAESVKKRKNGWYVRVNGRWVAMRNCQLQSEWAKENEQ